MCMCEEGKVGILPWAKACSSVSRLCAVLIRVVLNSVLICCRDFRLREHHDYCHFSRCDVWCPTGRRREGRVGIGEREGGTI